MWFTEDPWPPVMVLVVLAVVFGLAWNATRRGRYILLALGLVVLAFGVLVVEELVVTQAEEVEARVLALADDVVRGDVEKVLGYFSDEAQSVKSAIGSRLEDVQVEEDLRITDLQVTMDSAGTQAESHFRANGRVSYRSWTSNTSTRWNLTWQKEGTSWKILKVERLDPIEGEVINTWSGL